jgi:hypothetical protein
MDSNAARNLALGAAAVTILALCACGGGGASGGSLPAPAASPAALVMHDVLPAATDPRISVAFDAHVAVAPVRAPLGRLVVFLPGTNGAPSETRQFLAVAANAGLHAIGLSYPDTLALVQDCADDPSCYGPIRLQKFDGVARSPIDPVAMPDAILNRLTKLLLALDSRFPAEGWSAYLTGGAPRWSSIVVAGLSQGGGEAALIAKTVAVARVVQFSSTVDAVATPSGALAPATWVTQPGATPSAAYYGFDHTLDQFYAKIVVDWRALGMDAFGAAVSVDGGATPFGGIHELLTSRPSVDPHPSTVGDGITPLAADGTPLYAPVWRYMLGV